MKKKLVLALVAIGLLVVVFNFVGSVFACDGNGLCPNKAQTYCNNKCSTHGGCEGAYELDSGCDSGICIVHYEIWCNDGYVTSYTCSRPDASCPF